MTPGSAQGTDENVGAVGARVAVGLPAGGAEHVGDAEVGGQPPEVRVVRAEADAHHGTAERSEGRGYRVEAGRAKDTTVGEGDLGAPPSRSGPLAGRRGRRRAIDDEHPGVVRRPRLVLESCHGRSSARGRGRTGRCCCTARCRRWGAGARRAPCAARSRRSGRAHRVAARRHRRARAARRSRRRGPGRGPVGATCRLPIGPRPERRLSPRTMAPSRRRTRAP